MERAICRDGDAEHEEPQPAVLGLFRYNTALQSAETRPASPRLAQ